AEAVARQRQPVGAEGVGLDHVGAGLDVVAVHAAYQLRLRQAELVVAAVEEHAALVEQGAHGPVEQERALAEGFEERLHRVAEVGVAPPASGASAQGRCGAGRLYSQRRRARKASPRASWAR